jgi:hypothetical protein
MHVDAMVKNASAWERAPLTGASGLEDGFEFVHDTARVTGEGTWEIEGRVGNAEVRAWCHADGSHELWRAIAPGPPGEGTRAFLLVRARGATGSIRTVWSWSPWLAAATLRSRGITISAASGEVHEHVPLDHGWRMTRTLGAHATTVELGADCLPEEEEHVAPLPAPLPDDRMVTLEMLPDLPETIGDLTARSDGASVHRVRLGEAHYRRSEESWRDAGRPEALVAIGASRQSLGIEVSIRKLPPAFADRRDNLLDNEHPDVNSDGVQVHLRPRGTASALNHVWLLVPELPEPHVRVTPRTAAAEAIVLRASWRATSHGWQIRIAIPRRDALASPELALDVLVNEITPERERRRGQLVLSGARGEWVYLRGDRQDPSRYLPVRIAHD